MYSKGGGEAQVTAKGKNTARAWYQCRGAMAQEQQGGTKGGGGCAKEQHLHTPSGQSGTARSCTPTTAIKTTHDNGRRQA
jgi:hypothetical protein